MLHLKKNPLENGISEFIPSIPEKRVEQHRLIKRIGGCVEEDSIEVIE